MRRQYDLIADRRKTLTSQASNLMGFAGIIETILIATIVTAATDADARALLSSSIFHYPVLALAGIGFVSYIITIFFSLKSYWEPEWVPAPRIPLVPNKDRKKSIDHFWRNVGDYDRNRLAQQLGVGADYDQLVNNQKYDDLKKAFWWLRFGIIATATGGILFLIMGA